MKRWIAILLGALLAVLGAAPALANKVPISATFYDVFSEKYVTNPGSAFKSDNEQKWYVAISGVSNDKIFGARTRDHVTGASVSTYWKWSASVANKGYNYNSGAGMVAGQHVNLKGKKDDSSASSSAVLYVGSQFTP
jgi:hypothetical protein